MGTYGVQDLVDRYGVGEHTVLGWIRRGELKAINVSKKTGTRPKWRITQEALDAFEQLRTPTHPAPRGRRKKNDPSIIQVYS